METCIKPHPDVCWLQEHKITYVDPKLLWPAELSFISQVHGILAQHRLGGSKTSDLLQGYPDEST